MKNKIKKKKKENPNSLSSESRLHLAYATSPLNPLDSQVDEWGLVRVSKWKYPQNYSKIKENLFGFLKTDMYKTRETYAQILIS